MTQDAVVTKLLPNNMAEVAVTRTTACGGNCGSCESCIFQSELKTPARNLVGARPGQKVVIESKSSSVYKAAMLVYVLPITLVVLGYLLAYLAGGGSVMLVTDCEVGEEFVNLNAVTGAYGMTAQSGILVEGDGDHCLSSFYILWS